MKQLTAFVVVILLFPCAIHAQRFINLYNTSVPNSKPTALKDLPENPEEGLENAETKIENDEKHREFMSVMQGKSKLWANEAVEGIHDISF